MINSYHVYLTGSTVHARRAGRWPWRPQVESIGEWPWQAESPASLDLSGLRSEREAGSLCVYVGGSLAKLTCLALPELLTDQSEVKTIALVQTCKQLGLRAAEWEIAVQPSRGGPAVACVVRRDVMQALHEAAGARGLKLRSVIPYAATIWNAVRRQSGNIEPGSVLVVLEPDAHTLLLEKEERIIAASVMPHSDRTDSLKRDVQRLAMTYPDLFEGGIRLAVRDPGSVPAMLHSCRYIARDDYLTRDMYPDFRDLVFSTGRPDDEA